MVFFPCFVKSVSRIEPEVYKPCNSSPFCKITLDKEQLTAAVRFDYSLVARVNVS